MRDHDTFRKYLEKKFLNKKAHKYGAKPKDGFPSTLERETFDELLLRERAGEIRDLSRYASVDLGFGIKWKVDFKFVYVATGQPGWCEAKGKWTADAGNKLKMWRNGAGPGPLEIYMSKNGTPTLVEVVVPKPMKETK